MVLTPTRCITAFTGHVGDISPQPTLTGAKHPTFSTNHNFLSIFVFTLWHFLLYSW